MSSELQARAAEIRTLAADCKTLLDLSRATGWTMEVARHANTELALGLPEHGLRPAGTRVEGRPTPKSVKKGGK